MFAFVDESYQRLPDGINVTTFSAIMVRRDRTRELARSIWNLKRKFWPNDDPHDKELKGRLLLHSRKLESGIYDALIEGVLQIMTELEVIPFAVTNIGEEGSFKSRRNYFPRHFAWLIQRVNDYTAIVAPDDYATLVLDTVEDKTNRTLSEALSNFLFKSNAGQGYQHIVDFPTFGDSRTTPGVQLADFVAYAVTAKNTDRKGRIEQVHNRLREMTHDFRNGDQIDWGFRVSRG